MDAICAELRDFIGSVQSVYTDVTDKWLRECVDRFNLKKILVSEIHEDTPVYSHILRYHEYLSSFSTHFTLRLNAEPKILSSTAARVKARNSLDYKIQSYRTERHEFGKVPILKCLNDLFGARIILAGTMTFEQIQEFVSETFPNEGYRCIDSSKKEYRAVHLYFRAGNYAFPWELQIWNSCDARSNLLSHKKYKQGYAVWEKEGRGGGAHSG